MVGNRTAQSLNPNRQVERSGLPQRTKMALRPPQELFGNVRRYRYKAGPVVHSASCSRIGARTFPSSRIESPSGGSIRSGPRQATAEAQNTKDQGRQATLAAPRQQTIWFSLSSPQSVSPPLRLMQQSPKHTVQLEAASLQSLLPLLSQLLYRQPVVLRLPGRVLGRPARAVYPMISQRIFKATECVYIDMDTANDANPSGPFDARYVAFLETITSLRPRLHRYCSRMTGSVFDGEDVVQDALFEAYRKLDQFDDTRPLSPWLFRIAHNRCIDFLRRRGVRIEAETNAVGPEATMPTGPVFLGIGTAVEHLVLTLPPKERACVLLKDVFDYSLEEIAELVESTVGGVKAALSRGRSKLAASPSPVRSSRTADPELTRVLRLYVERFNRRDWNSLRDLITADARLRVADAFAGKLVDSPYFGNYERWSMPWRMAVGEVDGEPAVIILQRGADTWTPYSVVRLHVIENHIDCIVDYAHCPWVTLAAASVTVTAHS